MNHRCKCSVDLDRHVFTLEADWVANLVAVDMNTDDSSINQLDLDIRITRLKGNLLLRLSGCPLLHLVNDQLHLRFTQLMIRIGTFITNS